MIIGETKRLLVRTWQASDIEKLCALTREAGIGDFAISSYQNFSEVHAERWIAMESKRFKAKGLARFAVVLKEQQKIIGISGIFEMLPPDEKFVELNYRYPIAYRGQGFATEGSKEILRYGFQSLSLPAVDAVTEPENDASKKVLSRLGMCRIGSLLYEGKSWERWRVNKVDEFGKQS